MKTQILLSLIEQLAINENNSFRQSRKQKNKTKMLFQTYMCMWNLQDIEHFQNKVKNKMNKTIMSCIWNLADIQCIQNKQHEQTTYFLTEIIN